MCYLYDAPEQEINTFTAEEFQRDADLDPRRFSTSIETPLRLRATAFWYIKALSRSIVIILAYCHP